MVKTGQIKYYDSIKSKKIDWLWYPYIPFGKITLIQGDPGEGKTTFILSLIAALTNNSKLPFSDVALLSKCIYQNTEDDLEDTIKPRLDMNGADCSKVCFIDSSEETLSLDDERIEDAIYHTGARLVVLDPIQSFIGENTDMNRANSIRPHLLKLKTIAEKTQCAIVLVGHFNKNTTGKVGYRGLGSIDIQAAARSVLVIGKLSEDSEERILAQSKNNLAPIGKSLAFNLDKGKVVWKGELDITANELVNGNNEENIGKIKQAMNTIAELLFDGMRQSTEVFSICEEKGISHRTAQIAKMRMNVSAVKKKDAWYWELKE